MKYSLEIELDLPRDKVLELFHNTENLKKWQPGLMSFEHVSGEPGQVGAKSQIRYKMGKREVDMVETITEIDNPKTFAATYEAKGVWNLVKNDFVEVASNKTKWTTHNEFRCKGVMRIMTFLMPGAFKKQSFQHMKYFKDFAEKN